MLVQMRQLLLLLLITGMGTGYTGASPAQHPTLHVVYTACGHANGTHFIQVGIPEHFLPHPLSVT